MFKFLILLLTTLLLQGCSTTSSERAKTLLHSTSKKLQRNYKIEYANLVIMYDLAGLRRNNCIYAKDYCRIINDTNYNKIFLKKFKVSSCKNINTQAMKKTNQLKALVLTLNNKYKFLSHNEQKYLKQSKQNVVYIHELAKIDSLTSTIPIMPPEYNVRITSKYGMRKHPGKKKTKFHCGLDMHSSKSALIYAAADGIVSAACRKQGYGNLIELKHSNKFVTKYAHLKKIYIKAGETVAKGQIIGIQGNSGNSTGEHLHFEIWLNNKHVNPLDFLAHACNC